MIKKNESIKQSNVAVAKWIKHTIQGQSQRCLKSVVFYMSTTLTGISSCPQTHHPVSRRPVITPASATQLCLQAAAYSPGLHRVVLDLAIWHTCTERQNIKAAFVVWAIRRLEYHCSQIHLPSINPIQSHHSHGLTANVTHKATPKPVQLPTANMEMNKRQH